jgi:hypothetical protein
MMILAPKVFDYVSPKTLKNYPHVDQRRAIGKSIFLELQL